MHTVGWPLHVLGHMLLLPRENALEIQTPSVRLISLPLEISNPAGGLTSLLPLEITNPPGGPVSLLLLDNTYPGERAPCGGLSPTGCAASALGPTGSLTVTAHVSMPATVPA